MRISPEKRKLIKLFKFQSFVKFKMLNPRLVDLDTSYNFGSLQVEVHPGGVVKPRKESAEQKTKMRELSPRDVLRELSPVSARILGGQQTRSRDSSPRQILYKQGGGTNNIFKQCTFGVV